jgi:uncharacterized membrane protein
MTNLIIIVFIFAIIIAFKIANNFADSQAKKDFEKSQIRVKNAIEKIRYTKRNKRNNRMFRNRLY